MWVRTFSKSVPEKQRVRGTDLQLSSSLPSSEPPLVKENLVAAFWCSSSTPPLPYSTRAGTAPGNYGDHILPQDV